MKETFVEKRFSAGTMERIDLINSIIEEYQEQGFRLTARQLYYQLVARGYIENTERSYKNTTHLLSEARLAGLIDWDAIEDRGRTPSLPNEWRSIEHIMEAALSQFRLRRRETQPNHIELWVEKQALAGVLEPLARKHHVTLSVNKGYSSSSAMYEAAGRIKDSGKPSVILYLGDHDPSGEDMVRDIRDRLETFGCEDLSVIKIGLTMEQVEEYDPPPNPAKITDPRAAAYIEKYGPHSWEVDALRPETLADLVDAAISDYTDPDLLDAAIREEREQADSMRKAMKGVRR